MKKSTKSTKNFYSSHQSLLKEIIIEVQKKYPECRIFSDHCGLFTNRRGHPVFIGTKGAPDVRVMLPLKGVLSCVYIEVKSGASGLSKPQRNFKIQIEKINGIVIIGRNVEQVLTELEEYYGKHR